MKKTMNLLIIKIRHCKQKNKKIYPYMMLKKIVIYFPENNSLNELRMETYISVNFNPNTYANIFF